MYHFHAGSGPDTQAIGIALEEMYLDYTLAPQRAPVPVLIAGQARLPDAVNILPALARRTGRFLPPEGTSASPWLSGAAPDLDRIAAALNPTGYLLGPYSIADMALYPRLWNHTELPAVIEAWRQRLAARPAVGRGMGVVWA